MPNPSTAQNIYANQNLVNWSKSEKVVARTAFDAALKRELYQVMEQAKQMASQIKTPLDLWELEHYMTQRRKEIDRKVRLPLLAAHQRFRETSARKPTQAQVNLLFRRLLGRDGRSLAGF